MALSGVLSAMLIILATLIYGMSVFSNCNPIPDTNTLDYLQKYGYMEERTGNNAFIVSRNGNDMTEALKAFQRFAKLDQTGELDNETLEMMGKPRCGVKDITVHKVSLRRKRYALQGSTWPSNRLTYKISRYPTSINNSREVDEQIVRAFKIWSDVSSLKFRQKRRGNVDIDISFLKGEHGDGNRFDGPGKNLAHSFFPQYGGDIHFDDAETWTVDETGVNLFLIAAHELGHSLGLDHSRNNRSLMSPFYSGYNDSFHLHEDDIRAIQVLYGKFNTDEGNREFLPEDDPLGQPSDTFNAPDICHDSKIDAATRTQNGNSFVFKGNFYWRVMSDGLAPGYPRRISDDWDDLEGNLDAALTSLSGKTFFFKDRRYWRFTNHHMDPGYPKLISVGFEGIPDYLDAALVWNGNRKPYFFKGSQYWRYDSKDNPPVKDFYPLQITEWNGLPNSLDAAMLWENRVSYFFKGDKYWRYNDTGSTIDASLPRYPRSTGHWWFGCRSVE